MSNYDSMPLDPEQPPSRLRKLSRTWPVVGLVGFVLVTGAFITNTVALMIEGVAVLLAAIWLFTVWDLDDDDAWKDATVVVGLLTSVLVLGAGLWAWVGAV